LAAAFLVGGDTTPEKLRSGRENGLDLLHKRVPPMRLRAMVNQRLKARDEAAAATSPGL
jgi:hypothetical protein